MFNPTKGIRVLAWRVLLWALVLLTCALCGQIGYHLGASR